MADQKKNFTLVMSGTPDYAFAIGTVLIGIKKYSPNLFDSIIIYHDGIKKEDMAAMEKIFSFVEFKLYDTSIFNDLEQTDNIKRYSTMAFAIYEIFNELNYSKQVLYLDGDTILKKDISDIVNYGDVAMRPGGRPLEEALGFHLDGIDGISCANSGVVYVNDNISFNNISLQCYELTKKYFTKLFLPDQSILNIVLLKNNIKINRFPIEYNNNLNNISYKNFIIHQTTKKKFWSNGIVNFLEPEWEENYQKYLSLGGSKYQGKMSYKEYKEFNNRKIDKIIFLADIFKKNVEIFINSLMGYFSNDYISSYKNYILYLQLKNYKQIARFEIRFFPDECRFKFYSEDTSIIQLFSRYNNFLYKTKLTDKNIHIYIIEKLKPDFLYKKDEYINKINIFIQNINKLLLPCE